MNREYHRWWSNDLGRDMELLVFGHEGVPAVVFPTSCGRFFDFEDHGMVGALAGHIQAGKLQLFCVDSVDGESWYNRAVDAGQRIARQVQYESYVLHDVLPLIHGRDQRPQLLSVGCSFGGYHAVNIALRHPHLFTGFLAMGGVFDMKKLGFLEGFYNEACFDNLPLDYVPCIHDPEHLERLRRNVYVLATGVHDPCWNDNERLAAALRAKEIPVRLDVWGDNTGHDWMWWQKMAQQYLGSTV